MSSDGFRFASEEAAFAAAFADKFAEIEGDRIHFVEGGAGTPLLLVPGCPQTWLACRKIMPALAKRYRRSDRSNAGISCRRNNRKGPFPSCWSD
jgi:hypothetical protein